LSPGGSDWFVDFVDEFAALANLSPSEQMHRVEPPVALVARLKLHSDIDRRLAHSRRPVGPTLVGEVNRHPIIGHEGHADIEGSDSLSVDRQPVCGCAPDKARIQPRAFDPGLAYLLDNSGTRRRRTKHVEAI